MIFLFYFALLVGFCLLVFDVRGRLRAGPTPSRVMRVVGVAAAVAVGLFPLLGWQMGRWIVGPGAVFPLIAYSYLVLSIAFVIGVVGGTESRGWIRLRRGAYLGLLLLAGVPSWVLLFGTPAVALAGVALVRPSPAAGHRAEGR